ncbi:MAG: small subunit ribosomal protein S6 [Candidatus Peregrinibacteria bacterium Greene0416_19]|nr:MAG: small subunit ribosomal protein S6 [Candidatus Peregrinibacteria bacterium Greene0416_19]
MPTLTPSSAFAKATADKSEDTRTYECCILYPNPLGQKEEAELIKEIEALFSEASAKLMMKDVWGRRGLAYSIKGFTEGNYVVYYYELDPSKLKEIDRALGIMKNVLRHMLVKPPKHYHMVKYSELYEQWMKERETVEEKRSREQEEKVKERVAEKAKRQARQQHEEKKRDEAKPAMQGDVLTEKIEKLISDDSLDL